MSGRGLPTENVAIQVLARLARPLAHRLSPDTLVRIPLSGAVRISPAGSSAPPVLLGNDGNDRIASLLFWRGIAGWEPTTVAVFLQLIRPESIVVDVGANSGLFSLLAARRHPTARVHALEPVGRVFSRLESNVARNALDNVECHRLALGDHLGTLPLYVPAGEAVPVMASLVAGWSPDVEREDVECLTLDRFVATIGPGPIDVVKIDAEGSEDAVLRGGASTLARHRPFVFCEVLDRDTLAERVSAALAGHGYRVFAVAADGLRPVEAIAGGIDDDETHNYLFAPEDRLADVDALCPPGVTC